MKRLLDSVIFGFGATAGAKLFRELEEKVAGKEESDDDRVERERPKTRRDAEVEAELAALKKRMRKEER